MSIVRKAEPRDAGQLAEFAERTFREAFGAQNTPEDMDLHCRTNYGEQLQAREILDVAMTTLVADDSDQFLGYAQLRWGAAPAPLVGQRPLEIQRLYVDHEQHGRGVAQELMWEALRLAGEGGADLVWLGVWERNPRAIRFYQKFGFEAAGEHVFLLGSDPQRDLLMSRSTSLWRDMPSPNDSAKDPQTVVRRFIDAIHRNCLTKLAQLLAPEHCFVDSLGHEINGREHVLAAWRGYLAMVPDYRLDVQAQLFGGGMVALFGRASGSLVLDGVAVPDSAWSMPVAVRACAADGLLTEWQVYADNEPVRAILRARSGA